MATRGIPKRDVRARTACTTKQRPKRVAEVDDEPISGASDGFRVRLNAVQVIVGKRREFDADLAHTPTRNGPPDGSTNRRRRVAKQVPLSADVINEPLGGGEAPTEAPRRRHSGSDGAGDTLPRAAVAPAKLVSGSQMRALEGTGGGPTAPTRPWPSA
jgi:hypothetical protein